MKLIDKIVLRDVGVQTFVHHRRCHRTQYLFYKQERLLLRSSARERYVKPHPPVMFYSFVNNDVKFQVKRIIAMKRITALSLHLL